MKRIYIIMLTLLTVLAFSLPVLAFEEPEMGKTLGLTLQELDTSDPDVARLIKSYDFDTMRIKTDNGKDDGNFTSLEWITKSTYAEPNTQTKYQTSALWFKIGDHKGWVKGEDYRTQAKPGETIYERATISKEAFINAFMSNSSLTREEAEAIINTEEYLYTGAWISVYNDYNLNGEVDSGELKKEFPAFIDKEDIDKIANYHFGGSASVKSDWRSRFQKVKLNYKPAPDFFSTPEGESEWQEHFLTNAKTYEGEVGESITIPITLHNVGSEAITDFGCTWYGAGWDNLYWKEQDLELDKDETMDFEIDVVVPDAGAETRLVFRANIDGLTPASEINQDNNMMIIVIQPDGIDLVLLTENDTSISLVPGESSEWISYLTIYRGDTMDLPVETELNYSITNVNINKTNTFTINKHELREYPAHFTIYPNNTYVLTAEVKALNATDIDLSNNNGSFTLKVHELNIKPSNNPKDTPYKEKTDDDILVQLVG